MRQVVILTALLLSVRPLVNGNWDKPFVIYQSAEIIEAQTSYLDSATGKTHIVFLSKREGLSLWHYISMGPKGELSTPVILSMRPGVLVGRSVSITGNTSGQYLAMVLTLLRNGQPDLYFFESTSGGRYWSKPVLARSNDLEDNQARSSPVLLYSQSERVRLLYFRNYRRLCQVSRAPDTTIWGLEDSINVPECETGSAPSWLSGTLAEDKIAKEQLILFYVLCGREDKRVGIMGESRTNGVTWKRYYKRSYRSVNTPVTAITTLSENQVYGAMLDRAEDNSTVRATLFLYTAADVWNDIVSIPTHVSAQTYLAICKFKENMVALLFTPTKPYSNDYTSHLWYIPVGMSGNTKVLPTPLLSSKSEYVQVVCADDQILAIGTDCSKTLMGTRFNFTSWHSHY